MSDRRFVDTNILIYAHDLDADAKHERATAVQANADTLLTEDLNHSQLIEGIRVENPPTTTS